MIIEIAIAIYGLWLVALTVVVIGLAQHQAIVQAANVPNPPRINLDGDGPEIGLQVPVEAMRLLRDQIRSDQRDESMIVVFMSGSCGPCRDVAVDLAGRTDLLPSTIFLVAGSNGSASDLLRTLKPTGRPIVVNPEAQDIVRIMNVHSTPFAFEVVEGRVRSKRFIRRADDLALFRHASIDGGS